MRALQKGSVPSVLTHKGVAWRVAYVSDPSKTNEKWRHAEIKTALADETDHKCAYCESKMSGITYPHVDHIIPKSARRDLAHEWTNLTWACPICNTEKGDYFSPESAVVNPYVDDIESFLQFAGDFVYPRLGSSRGEITVTMLKLNRMDLVEARVTRIERVLGMLQRWHDASGPRREVLAAAIRTDAVEGEYTAAVTTFLRLAGFPLADEG